MAEQTVRKQLAEALEGVGSRIGYKWHRLGCEAFQRPFGECDWACVQARRALDRHRAEPEGGDTIPIDDAREAVEPPHRWG